MKLNLGLCQMKGSVHKEESLRRAEELVRRAARDGAQLAVLPEMFNCPYETSCFPRYAEPAGGPTWQMLSHLARELGIYLVGGSVPEEEAGRIYNTSYIFSPSGAELARHRKVHLFDINVPGGQVFQESETLTAGDQVTVVDTEFGRIGVAICFDIRFSELFRLMCQQGARLIVVPAAFNMTTGPVHWELAFRMRALDSQCFVAGCSPARDETASYVAYGHSLACNPWGTVLTDLGEREAVQVVTLDLDEIDQYRAQLPILAGRRTDLYRTELLPRP